MAAAEGESDAKDFTNEFVVEDAARESLQPAGRARARGRCRAATLLAVCRHQLPSSCAPTVCHCSAAAHGNQEAQRETDPHRLAQRQKQLAMGKNTLGYQRYREAVPK